MLSSIFQEAGYKTGLYTSPHLKDFRERIRVNGNMIPESNVIDFVKSQFEIFSEIKPSFFEWAVALAFKYFEVQKVEIAIIETGLGGRLDSTNIINPELSIITNISLDHIDMLGDTLEKIANEKAGIIKRNTTCIIGDHSGQKAVFQNKADNSNAIIRFANEIGLNSKFKTDLTGSYQTENIKTVLVAINELIKQDWRIDVKHIEKGLLNTSTNTNIKGRWQIIQENPKIILETAHNEAGIKVAMEQLKEENPETLHMVIGFVKDKSLTKILPYFPKNAKYYFCQAKIQRSLEVEILKNICYQNNLLGKSYPSVYKAISAAKIASKKEDIIYIGGSNFTVAEAL
jgi:dihydrofolate synthase/folylpolyglutamate synthase